MCGIAGFLEPSALSVHAPLVLANMLTAIGHRGPDGSGEWLNDVAGVALGHRRLAVMDLSQAGRQPMVSPSGRYVLTFNGEVYNFNDIKTELGARNAAPNWRGHSDTEVLLAAFDYWGVQKTLPLLNGMFAFAVWDQAEMCLILARDRLGEKPLYYGRLGSTFVFGSELKAFQVHPKFEKRIDRQSVSAMLRYDYVPAPRSIWRGIYKLPVGHYLVVAGKTNAPSNPTCFWDAGQVARAGIEAPAAIDSNLPGRLEGLIQAAVKRQMTADVPLGAFLSGGIDSSLIVAMMQARASRPIATFTIGFDEPQFDEAPYAKAVAAHLGTDHNEVYVTARDALDIIPKLPAIWDEPFGDSSSIPTYMVSSIARTKVTVALSGDGGDELFGGYSRYVSLAAIERLTRPVPATARGIVTQISRLLASQVMVSGHAGRAARIVGASTPEQLYNWSVSRLEDSDQFVAGATAQSNTVRVSMPFRADFVTKMMYSDMMTYLPDNVLVKVDRAAMAKGLEVRAPFLDKAVIDFAWQLPISAKIRGGEGKQILREILSRHVPLALFDRPKMGFAVPIDKWLKNELRDWAENLLDETRLRDEGVLNPDAVRSLWRGFLAGKRRHHRPVWNILMYQSWAELARPVP